MSNRFEFTPQRLKAWADMEARGMLQPDIARELGCAVCTLIRYKRRVGRINAAKRRGGIAGMAKRYGATTGASP
ncbi:MAG: hypothetical protein ABL893_05910 [Hyphomicrobium sp.]